MHNMKYSDVKKSDKISLQNKIDRYKREIFGLRFQRSDGNKIDTSRFKQVKRNIARIKTFLNCS